MLQTTLSAIALKTYLNLSYIKMIEFINFSYNYKKLKIKSSLNYQQIYAGAINLFSKFN